MRLKTNNLGFVVNFLLGVAWASVFIGAVTSFFSLYESNLFYAFIYAMISAIPGLIAVLLIEHFITGKEKLAELKKQTQLLERLLDEGNNVSK